jgi:hypothetical protein
VSVSVRGDTNRLRQPPQHGGSKRVAPLPFRVLRASMVATAITRLRPPVPNPTVSVAGPSHTNRSIRSLFYLGVVQVLSHVHGSSGAPSFLGLYPFVMYLAQIGFTSRTNFKKNANSFDSKINHFRYSVWQNKLYLKHQTNKIIILPF